MISKLENDKIMVEVDSLGAEMKKLFLKKDNKNYLWHGDSKYWKRTAPVLFPIVGRLKNDSYIYNNKEYKMTQHGFARDNEFQLIKQTESSLTYVLKENLNTLEKYPFKFRLEVKYRLKENLVKVAYKVTNQDQKEMYFSIGAHPAFYWPLNEDEKKEDYYLEFEKIEKTAKYLLEAGLLNNQKEPILDNQKILELTPDIFKDDALVFKNLKSEQITLKSSKSEREIKIRFEKFPYLGIWSQSVEAPFICLEPWYGIADSVDSSGRIEEKEGIKSLKAGNSFESKYTITIE